MIELRWLREWGGDGDKVCRKLQYRQWIVRLDAGGAITPCPLPVEWTEWVDVPVEEAP